MNNCQPPGPPCWRLNKRLPIGLAEASRTMFVELPRYGSFCSPQGCQDSYGHRLAKRHRVSAIVGRARVVEGQEVVAILPKPQSSGIGLGDFHS
jgi:hypothetical protein